MDCDLPDITDGLIVVFPTLVLSEAVLNKILKEDELNQELYDIGGR
jgi:hypothetical protein